MSLHHEVLTRAQEEVLRRLAPAADAEGLYLAEGTAVALRLGHRRSIDLDWFSEERIAEPDRTIRRLQGRGVRLEPTLVEPGTIYGEVDGVRVSVIQFPYPSLQPVQRIDGVPVAHLDDLACMKLDVLATRGARKDFVDVHALATEHAPLEDLVAHYAKRFPRANVAHLWMSLTYFEDAERSPMPEMLSEVTWEVIKRDFLAWTDAVDLGR